jgi:hypothetical protein
MVRQGARTCFQRRLPDDYRILNNSLAAKCYNTRPDPIFVTPFLYTVAADALATTMFGLAPEDIASTVAAHSMGLGQMDLNKMNLIKRSL